MIEILNDVSVELVDHMGDDERICAAARVSTGAGDDPDRNAGLIKYLMSSRHGTPWESCVMQFRVEAPIFVAREFMRHRIASYSEVSGRYRQLEPRFYAPKADRKLVNVGTSARPEFSPGTSQQVGAVANELLVTYEYAWDTYRLLLADGIANEVARMVLPVGIMTEFIVTMNLRSLMNFLSLRVDSEDSAVRSRPQWEIQLVAEKMEAEFARLFPITHKAFVDNGRVAP